MKRIIDGVTYNTDTSTLIAKSDYEVDFKRAPALCEGALYQTRGGAYFVHERIDTGETDNDRKTVYRDRFEALTAEEAEEWKNTGQVEIFADIVLPPEAQAEAEAGATLYLRVPTSLKARVDEAAEQAKLSVNAWAMRALEKAIERQNKRETEGDTELAEVTYKPVDPNSMRGRAVAIMFAHQTAPMEEVLPLIAKELGVTLGRARSFYVWCVVNKRAPGVAPP